MFESHIFGDSIQETRKQYKITQTRIAGWMDVAPSSVKRWENYEMQPSKIHRKKWVFVYDTITTYPADLWDARIEEIKNNGKQEK